tara:strand:- start:3927 stop:4586 length:660 start_codon:yes stop_codon:yes gene_type:complete
VKLEVSVHEKHDIVGHIPTFLSDAEIEELYEINKHRKWPYAATRWSGYNSKIRKCKKRSRIEFPFYDRLKKAVDLYNNNTYKFHLYDERKKHEINMVRYDEPGMHFRPHRDYRPGLKEIHTGMTTRKISLSIQLSNSEEYEGGDLEIVESYTTPDVFVDSNFPPDFLKQRETFRHTFPTIRKKGSLTIFTSIHEHESRPLISGKRDIIVGFFRGAGAPY